MEIPSTNLVNDRLNVSPPQHTQDAAGWYEAACRFFDMMLSGHFGRKLNFARDRQHFLPEQA